MRTPEAHPPHTAPNQCARRPREGQNQLRQTRPGAWRPVQLAGRSQNPEQAYRATPSPASAPGCDPAWSLAPRCASRYISGCGRVAGSALRSWPARSPWKPVPGYLAAESPVRTPPFLPGTRPGPARRKRGSGRGVKGREEGLPCLVVLARASSRRCVESNPVPPETGRRDPELGKGVECRVRAGWGTTYTNNSRDFNRSSNNSTMYQAFTIGIISLNPNSPLS